MTIMPTWLARHLEQTGRLDAAGVRRTAAAGRCPRCGARLLVGLDSDLIGMTARVDPWPIDKQSEFIALVGGRWTYNLVATFSASGRRCFEIDRRAPYHISGSTDWTVVAEHRCGAPLPAIDRLPPLGLQRTEPDEPPF